MTSILISILDRATLRSGTAHPGRPGLHDRADTTCEQAHPVDRRVPVRVLSVLRKDVHPVLLLARLWRAQDDEAGYQDNAWMCASMDHHTGMSFHKSFLSTRSRRASTCMDKKLIWCVKSIGFPGHLPLRARPGILGLYGRRVLRDRGHKVLSWQHTRACHHGHGDNPAAGDADQAARAAASATDRDRCSIHVRVFVSAPPLSDGRVARGTED